MTEQTMNTLFFSNLRQSAMTLPQSKTNPNWLASMIDEKLNGVRQEILSAAYSENCIICERALEQERSKNVALEERNYVLEEERRRSLEIIFCLRLEIEQLRHSLNEARGLIPRSRTQICELPQANRSWEDDSTTDSSFECQGTK